MDPGHLTAGPDAATLLSHSCQLASVDKKEDDRCLLLARIRYFGPHASGLLVVVKPRRMTGLPLEVTGYASRNESFPQQTTADQFFDEEQWEAYHQLGLFVGGWLTPQGLNDLAAAT